MNYPKPNEAFSAYKLVHTRIGQLTEGIQTTLTSKEPSDIKELEQIEDHLMTDIQALHHYLESIENMIIMRRNSQAILSEVLEYVSPDQEAAGTNETIDVLPEEEEVDTDNETIPTKETNEPTMAELLEEKEQGEEEEKTVNEEKPGSNSRSSKILDGERVYRFYRRLYNGFILLPDKPTNTDSDKYFIPEKMINDMGVEEGDYLAITNSYISNGRQLHNLVIREKGTGANMDRLQYEYCLVHEDVSPIAFSPYYVDNSYTKGSLMQYKDGEYSAIHRLYLTESDIKKHSVKEGDVLTVAYWVNNPQDSVRVIEINEVGRDDDDTSTKTTKPVKKASVKKQDTEADTTTYPNIVDKVVGVVGFEHFHSRYEKVLSSYGATVATLTGDEKSFKQFAAVVDASDVIVFVVEMMSHHAYNEIKAYAKSKEVPHVIATKSGANFVAKLANDKLGDEV